MIDFMKLPAVEAEALAYAEGFTGTAALFARIADLQKALGEAVNEIEQLPGEALTPNPSPRFTPGAFLPP